MHLTEKSRLNEQQFASRKEKFISQLATLLHFLCTCHFPSDNLPAISEELCGLRGFIQHARIAIHKNIMRLDANNIVALHYSCTRTAITWSVAMEITASHGNLYCLEWQLSVFLQLLRTIEFLKTLLHTATKAKEILFSINTSKLVQGKLLSAMKV